MSVLRCAAALALFAASANLAWAQPRYVELPGHPLAAASNQDDGAPQKTAITESIVGGPSTELRLVPTSSGHWQFSCEQMDADGPSSYSQWLERVARHREVIR